MKFLMVVGLCLQIISCQNQPDPRDAKIASLEQRVSKLESNVKEHKQADGDKQAQFKICITTEADAIYDASLRMNATAHHGTMYTVPTPAAEQAMRLRQQKIEQCKLLYGN
jgi:hypothetical protein